MAIPSAASRASEGTYYEISLLADGVEKGAAQAQAALRQVEQQADKAAAAVDRVGTSSNAGNRQAFQEKAIAIAELNKAFKDGAISQEVYEQRAQSLGIKIKTLSAAQKEAAAAFVAGGTAAGAAAVGIEAAEVATSGLLATIAPFAIAAIGMELGVRLIRAAIRALGFDASDAAKKVDGLIDKFRQMREEARQSSQRGLEDLQLLNDDRVAKAQTALDAAKRGNEVSVAGKPGVTALVVDQNAVRKAQDELNEARQTGIDIQAKLNELEFQGAEKQAESLGRVLQLGNATNDMRAKATVLVENYNRQIATLLASGKTDDATIEKINRLQGMVDALTAADKKADRLGERAQAAAEKLKNQQDAARQAFGSAIAGQTPGVADNFDQQINNLTEQAVKAKLSADEIRELVAQLRAAHTEGLKQQAQSLNDDFRSQLVATTKTQVDDLVLALDKLDEKIAAARAAGVPIDEETVAKLRAAKIEAIETAKEVEALQDALEDAANLHAIGNDIGAVVLLNSKKEELEAELKITTNVDAQRRIKREILAIDKEIKGIVDGQKTGTAEIESNAQKLAGIVAGIAGIAYGLASAFAGANSEITKMLAGISQASSGVSSLIAAAGTRDSSGNAIGLGGALQTSAGLGALGQIIGGGIALGTALFGQSAEEKARADRQRENTEALRELSHRIGNLGAAITGTDTSRVSDAANDPRIAEAVARRQRVLDLGRFPSTVDLNQLNAAEQNITKSILAALDAAGLSAAQFAEIARQLGITVDATHITLQNIEDVKDALKKAELGEFADTFAGQMAKLAAEINVFDIKDPIAQFKEFRKALDGIKDKGGILSDTIDKFDLSNPEGIAAAIKALQDLFAQVTSGQIDSSLFGGLSGQDLVDAIQKALDILKDQTAASGTGGFNNVQTITEVTGSRIGALLATANIFEQRTAEAAEAILLRLGGAFGVPMITPPTVPSGASPVNGFAPNVTVSLTVNVSGLGADTEEIGIKIGDATIRAIDRGLGGRAKWAQRSIGNVVRN